MEFCQTGLPGCIEIRPGVFRDARGLFAKTFHAPSYESHGLPMTFAEVFHSASRRGVIRGLHFQVPPHEHGKLVYCVHGEVFDAVVDLRAGSPTFGQYRSFQLSADNARAVFIPPGLAHGFCALTDEAVVVYHVTSVHSPAHDAGILWDSVGLPWPVQAPVVSQRDQAFPSLAEFKTPFVYPEGAQ